MKKNKKGFTLLEILLVIALIGVLIAIALVAINPNRQLAQARNLGRREDITNIYNAIEQYTIKNKGNLPNSISTTYKEICDTGTRGVTDALPSENYCDGKVDLRVLVPKYISSIPKDSQVTLSSSTGYEVLKTATNQITMIAKKSELNQNIAINLNVSTPVINFSNRIIGGTIASGISSNGTVAIPYTGGLGQSYNNFIISSTGVTGLTATLSSGNLQVGSGNLIFNITGTTNSLGVANFSIDNIAGVSGSFSIALCPVGYIQVPGNSLYGTNNFCVMKYEAKAVEISNPTVGLTTPNTGFNTIANDTTATTSANGRAIASLASGFPVANISQSTAISYCNTIGGNLISNLESMTIARNIESQPSNWTGGAVGNGGLWRGHSDSSPTLVLAASTDDSQGYTGTGNSSPSIERRTHTLSNGEIIWDFSGNVWEWTNDIIIGLNKPNNSSGSFTQQWTSISNYGTLSYDLTRPSNNTWSSTQNMGQYYAGNLTADTFTFRRGGSWISASLAGVFALSLDMSPLLGNNNMGFRCVMR
jgi:prepilin-type N-terminal cleavage/methylation domain-containing protein